MTSGYSVVFDDDSRVIHDKKYGQITPIVHMTQNRMFPIDVSNVVSKTLIARGKNEAKIWHLRYGHLNVNGLRLLSKKEMVVGLPKIGELDFC